MTIALGPISIDLWHILSAGIGGGMILIVQGIWRAAATDVAKRITASLWLMRKIDRITPAVLRHPMWSGIWDVTWEVDSANFVQINEHRGELYRCFNAIALEGLGTTVTGHEIPYGFVGRLSRDKSIATGTWFDRRWGDGGYHGVYQVRVAGTGDRAVGLWCGFAETGPQINANTLIWERVTVDPQDQ